MKRVRIAAVIVTTAALLGGLAAPSTAGGRPRIAEGTTVSTVEHLAGGSARLGPRSI